MDFTSRQLRAFHFVAEQRSFARAADRLYMTPSGVSVLIKELERQLGFRLFDRTTRQVELTAHGRDLLAVTRSNLQSLESAMTGIGQAAKGEARTVSLGTTPWMAANVLPPAIKGFRERRPDVRVRLFDGDLPAIARQVAAGKIDLGLGIFDRMPGFRRAPFFRFSLMVVRPGSAGLDRRSTRWTALKGQTLISLTPDYPHQQLIEKQLKKSGVVYTRGQTVNLLDTQIGLVEAGEGIAVIPSFGLPACRSRSVTMSELIEPVIRFEFEEISHRGRRLSDEANQFSAFLKRYIATWAGESGMP